MSSGSGVQLQERVSRLLSRRQGKPVLKPNRTLALKDTVANRKPKKGEATCITEISVLMACWKLNNFTDSQCSSEVTAFYSCVERAQAAMKNKSEAGGPQGGRLSPKQATTLLKRFPNQRSEL